MIKETKLKYVDGGFIGYNPKFKEMIFTSKEDYFPNVSCYDGTSTFMLSVMSHEIQ
tara:strand:- start:2061 stop:2228 length:168 start_codon:yes stop_codon:yes gene_type:complete